MLTVLAAFAAYHLTNHRVITALAATWAGNTGYFGYLLVADVIVAYKQLHSIGKQYKPVTFWKNIRALFIEFGFAELLDSFVIRPALMYYLPILTDSLLVGIIMAKLAADITFYLPAIFSYEVSKERFRKYH